MTSAQEKLINIRLLHMTNVTLELLRGRLEKIAKNKRYYEYQATKHNRLALHETWRHSYLSHPYLVGAPDDRVDERFKNIFMNVSEISVEGKLTPVSMQETDEFMQTFTHMLEEYGVRANGMASADVIQAARQPLIKYFEHGKPFGLTLFDGYTPPDRPYLVKYGKREFLEPMFQNGTIRLANADYYNKEGFLNSIRDDETSRIFFIPTYKERLAGKNYINLQGNKLEFFDDDIVLPLTFDDYYLFSLCEKIHYRMPTDFEADSAIVIHSPEIFKQKFISTFLALFGDWIPMEGRVTYYDPYRDYTKFKIPEMAKHFSYAYQKEFRIAFRSRSRISTNLEPLYFSIGTMSDYADFIHL
ncbi:MAG: hypothetical protein G3W58_08655 [Pantoea ananatis]|uniref:hypothetical protein n=1 Tax=Pantoea TaxID=53335 RepID=UPI0005B2B799|nr:MULTISPECIES: hypothetical protein [Pantoea]MCS4493429.1 hypothetical protein [Pantoea sp. B623]NEK81291.1 hypothetical protein [Pantoea ananatis]REF11792.1 hypothetical protein C7428_1018 [Pantoea ananatis]